MHHLELVKLSAGYGDQLVLDQVDFSVGKGEIVSIVGPSGSGKSTILRVLVGLLPPRAGKVFFDNVEVNYHKKQEVRAIRDRVAIVFQQYNLFQNMDVLRNVTVAPVKIKGRERRQVEAEAVRILGKVGLGDKLKSYPDQLSGGQQQRVAIARALVLQPEILLLDEVTSALDPELVMEVLDIIRLLAAEGMTMVIVSHEMGFVREIATKVVMMDRGRVIEGGTPKQFFETPQTERAREFVSTILRH